MTQSAVLVIVISLSLFASIAAAVWFYWRGDVLRALFWLVVTLLVGLATRRILGL